MASDRALILFFKNPVAGRVKTRLAATVGEAQALTIYRFLLERTRRTALEIQAGRFIYYSDFIDEQDAWSVPEFQKRLQHGISLGHRMHHALAETLQNHHKAVLVGGDIPALTPAVIESAFAMLDEADVVFGPATDGGYYLVGVRRPRPEIFEGIAWSTPGVLEESLSRCRQARLRVALVQALSDVDTEADWKQTGLEIDI